MQLIAGAYEVEVLRDAGVPSNRLDLVILGDGYRVEDQTKLSTDAKNVLTRLFEVTPWKEYAGLVNVSVIHVISNEEGADNGSAGLQRDTALNSYFNCAGNDRTICFTDSIVYGIANQATPMFDQLVVLVNDSKYGGSGGTIAALSTNVQAPEILIHELGHSVGGLADEYDLAYPAFPACNGECPEANASPNSSASVKWSHWLEASTPLPTPEGRPEYASVIGTFEGARYKTTGLYRPKDRCLMNVLGVPNCSVCTEQLIRKFFNRVDPIEAFTPTQTTSACDVTLTLTPAPISPLSYLWKVNGVDRAAGPSLTLPVGTGLTVSVVATHTTPLVRSDPMLLLKQTVTFPQITAGTGCDPDGGSSMPLLDAGDPFDAGEGDAGADAGVPVGSEDAGTSPSSSMRVRASSEGCGCTATPASGLWLVLALAAVRLRAARVSFRDRGD